MLQRYTTHHVIADALYGQVVLAQDTATGDMVAMKKMDVFAARKHELVRGDHRHVDEDIEIEKHVNRILSANGGHPHILRMRADFIQDGYDHMIFDYCAGGDLFDALDHGPLPPPVAQRYFRQLALATSYMHAKGIAHRDLSLENVLLHNDNCYVCDFGLAASVSSRCHDVVGKPFYIAPESLAGREYDPAKADVWSLGVMLFMMLTAVPLCTSASLPDSRFLYLKRHGVRRLLESWHIEMGQDELDLLEHMLCVNPDNRYRMDQVVAHEFVRDRVFERVDSPVALKGDAFPHKATTTSKAFAIVQRFFHRSMGGAAVL
ncbi:CAMK protein kinase [Aphanomyces invadans]|uniref:CAMK protein kinase n=1 Tax=Aphanomyces invadans TaxID=157072 RepID=A0A024TXP6_9STRA|nr:CAMK protein kinase [Aphanomyces invadans]ETV98386.1 CAMK protein kinase [Aphanomyces invadans]RHY23808.1 hypothetical protein DYB32_009061 [Aphanomyces invadans]|eukprot:XP_008873261.1 CAMK protein kinase [Aphanomyces invadans]